MNPNYFERNQLYDLVKDPLEKNNIAEIDPEKAAEMQRLLIRKLRSFPNRPYGELVK